MFGLVLAAIAFFWYYAAVVIMVGALGYMLGVGFFEWLGFGTGLIALVVGLHPRVRSSPSRRSSSAFRHCWSMVVSAFSGAAAVVNGVVILIGPIKVEELSAGIFGSLLHNATGSSAWSRWSCIAAAAIWYQLRGRRRHGDRPIDRAQYRYA